MTIEVIGAGFGRTGTMSLKVALEELGFGPCYHMIELFGHPEHVELWEAASQGKTVNWEELFSGYRATTDWPACSFYEELMERYPDAKVVLTVRDPDRWYESTYNTIYGMRRMISSPIFRLAAPFRPGLRRAATMNDRLIWEDTFGGSLEDRERAIEVFNRHNEEVKERVQGEKLLVYEVKDGWGPLCEFLGVEVPKDKPFPHLNDTDTFRTMIRRRLAIALAAPVVAVSLAGLVLLLRLRRRHRRKRRGRRTLHRTLFRLSDNNRQDGWAPAGGQLPVRQAGGRAGATVHRLQRRSSLRGRLCGRPHSGGLFRTIQKIWRTLCTFR